MAKLKMKAFRMPFLEKSEDEQGKTIIKNVYYVVRHNIGYFFTKVR